MVEFMYLVFTRMPGECYRRAIRVSVAFASHAFGAVIKSF